MADQGMIPRGPEWRNGAFHHVLCCWMFPPTNKTRHDKCTDGSHFILYLTWPSNANTFLLLTSRHLRLIFISLYNLREWRPCRVRINKLWCSLEMKWEDEEIYEPWKIGQPSFNVQLWLALSSFMHWRGKHPFSITSGSVFPLQHYWRFGPDNALLSRDVLCVAGCWVASLHSTQYMPVAPHLP